MSLVLFLILCHRAAAFEDRIVGAPQVEIDRFPYMAAMQHLKYGTLICSASIIHVYWLLTAAHCQFPVKEFRIRVGSSFLEHNGDIYKAEKFIPYPKYVFHKSKGLDIALIKVANQIHLKRTVQPINLAGRQTAFPFGTGCEFAGYGRTMVDAEDAQERHLRFIGMPILHNEECARYNNDFQRATMLCVGFTKVKAGSCYGDSGAPLVCKGVIFGVAVFSFKNCLAAPNGFVRVIPFLDFIRQETGMKV